jgi:hypothetical protein
MVKLFSGEKANHRRRVMAAEKGIAKRRPKLLQVAERLRNV